MKSHKQVARQFRKHQKITQSGNGKQLKNTRECQAFYAGNIMNYEDKIQFTDTTGRKKRATVNINKVKPYVNAVKGFMAQNRRTVKYIARQEREIIRQNYTDYANAFSDYIRDNANADQVETQMDGDMLINGYGALETAMTYGDGYATRDPNGEVIMGRLCPKSVGWDPAARAINLLDSRWVYYRKEYDLEEAVELFDADGDEFEQEPDNDEDYDYIEDGGSLRKIRELVDYSSESRNTVNVYFYQWYEIEPYWRCANPLDTIHTLLLDDARMILEEIAQGQEEDSLFSFDPAAEILDCNADVKKKLEEAFGDRVQFVEFKRRVYYAAVLSGKKVFSAYRLPTQQGFTIKFKTGDFDEHDKIWTGMVNSMMDPVKYYNKALTELMFTIAANSKGGVYVEEDAVEDIREFEEDYARTDAVIQVKKGALTAGKIQDKARPHQTTGLEGIVQEADNAIVDVTGIDRSFLGSSESRTETAILQRQRIKQVTSVLACFFDSVTLYQKEWARMMLDFMKIMAENHHGGMFKFTEENGKVAFIKISADKLASEYDIDMEEAPDSATDKEEKAQTLVGMAKDLISIGHSAGPALYGIALKYLNLDTDDREKAVEILMPKNEVDPAYVQQLERQVEALMSERGQAELQELVSKAVVNMAKAADLKDKARKTDAEVIETLESARKISKETDLATSENVSV